jgi:hypothetical protein
VTPPCTSQDAGVLAKPALTVLDPERAKVRTARARGHSMGGPAWLGRMCSRKPATTSEVRGTTPNAGHGMVDRSLRKPALPYRVTGHQKRALVGEIQLCGAYGGSGST